MARSHDMWRWLLRRYLVLTLLLALQGTGRAEDEAHTEWIEWKTFSDLVARLAPQEADAFMESLDVLLWDEPLGTLRLSGTPYRRAAGPEGPAASWCYQDELVLWRGAEWELRQERSSALLQPLRGERWITRVEHPASLIVWGRAQPGDRHRMLGMDTWSPYHARPIADEDSLQRRSWIEKRPTGASKPAPDAAEVVTLAAVIGLVKRWIAAPRSGPDPELAAFSKVVLRIPQLAPRVTQTPSPPTDAPTSNASQPSAAPLVRTDLVVKLQVSENGTLLHWEHGEASASGGRTVRLSFSMADGSITEGSIVEPGAKPAIELTLRPTSGPLGPVYWEPEDKSPLVRGSLGKLPLLERYRRKYMGTPAEGQAGTTEAEALLSQQATQAALMSVYALATADGEALEPDQARSIINWKYVFQLRGQKDVADPDAFRLDQIKQLTTQKELPDKEGRTRITMLLEHAFRSASFQVSRTATQEPFKPPAGQQVVQETFLCKPEPHLLRLLQAILPHLQAILPHLEDPGDFALRVDRLDGQFWLFYLPREKAGD